MEAAIKQLLEVTLLSSAMIAVVLALRKIFSGQTDGQYGFAVVAVGDDPSFDANFSGRCRCISISRALKARRQPRRADGRMDNDGNPRRWEQSLRPKRIETNARHRNGGCPQPWNSRI